MSSVKRRWSRSEKRQRQTEKEKDEIDIKITNKRVKGEVIEKGDEPFLERLKHCTSKIGRKSVGSSAVPVIAPPFTDDTQFHIESCCTSSMWMETAKDLTRTCTVVKPLLILDLNGILCHRIRSNQDDPLSDIPFRTPIDHVAGTAIIGRPNVEDFLIYLSHHFCLAVWTSAKSKTAKHLLKLIFPTQLQDKLLFVWSQGQCQKVPSDTPGETIYRKSLTTVWDVFPLWNASNTLLMDDSPEKCPIEERHNTLHPPPLHGKCQEQLQVNSSNGSGNSSIMSDEENAEQQRLFFSLVIQHYKEPRQAWPNSEEASLFEFLGRTARHHMGWRGNVKFNRVSVM